MKPTTLAPSLPCKKCKGTRITKGLLIGDKQYPDEECLWCKGNGTFDAPNLDQIITLIKGRKGLRSRRPDDSRAYYVWRLARFHGGVDVTLPMMAELDSAADPYRDTLDLLARAVAQKVYGSGNRGTDRWHQAMYG